MRASRSKTTYRFSIALLYLSIVANRRPPSTLLPSVVGIPHRPDATFAVDVEAGCPARLPIGIMRGGHPVLDCPPETVLRTAQLLSLGVGFDDRLGVSEFALRHCVALVSSALL